MGLATSIVQINRADKIQRLAGAIAVRIAKERKDPDVKKLLKFRRLYWKFKAKIQKKYMAKALPLARKMASSSETK